MAHPAIVTGPVQHGRGPALTPHGLADEDSRAGGDQRRLLRAGRWGWAQGVHRPAGAPGARGTPRDAAGGAGESDAQAGPLRPQRLRHQRNGRPAIAWASATSAPLAYDAPLISHRRPQPWPVVSAVGCGPTLIQRGRVIVTDRLERLASPGALPRTFVAYDAPSGRPTHFVLGVASAMTYQDLATFLADYFSRYDGTQAEAAMCLDGGAPRNSATGKTAPSSHPASPASPSPMPSSSCRADMLAIARPPVVQ